MLFLQYLVTKTKQSVNISPSQIQPLLLLFFLFSKLIYWTFLKRQEIGF